ncbi:MAG: PAS domain S-box protein [Candidatus Omnitrophica bacterium]|nr:PAS domain S-box protein [Candidatus Omnitrophota bacterium]
MNITTVTLIFTLLFNALIIYLVYKSNPKRLSNRVFSLLGINIALWNIVILFIVNAKTPSAAEVWIRAAFIIGSIVTLNLVSLVCSIGEKEPSFLKKKGFMLMALFTAVNFSLGFFPPFIREIIIKKTGAVDMPYATYGWPFFVYFVLFLTVAGYAFMLLLKKLKTEKGLARAEIQYILLGCLLGFLYVILCNFVLHIILKTQALAQFSPLGVVIMNGIIGYGIAKYKILDVSIVMQRGLSYVFIVLFAFLLYNVSLFIFKWLFFPQIPAESLLPETLALLVVIFAFEPARKKINDFVSYSLFKMEYSPEDLLAGLEKVLYTAGDMKVFIDNCLRIVLESVGIKNGKVYFMRPGEQKPYFLISKSMRESDVPEKSVYPVNMEKALGRRLAPLVKGEIERRIPSDENRAVIGEMEALETEMAIPLLSEQKLFGMLCFGEKSSGKFYTPHDEEIFARLSHYLSLKVQNFMFYEQLERVRIYQETLLENLPIGVIGTDAGGMVTVVNREAERIIGFEKGQAEGRHFNETLPDEIRKIFSYSIEKKKGLRHLKFVIERGGEEISLDATSSLFSDREGNLSGAQVIFADVTHINELEEGMKRAEKFASLGIMAAGIAHEIKNPLVSIQTFAHLLPERYNDKEFREMFSSLTIKEVARINALIEQILVFAKPRGAVFEEVNLIDVLKTTAILLSAQFPEKSIEIKEDYCQDVLNIEGDEGKLKQAFLNICINSAQSLKTKGVIEISADENGASARVEIRDSGCGIKKDVIDKIFEPFFTTREKGTGLGLAIVTRIIDEHKGSIKVESAEGKGTRVIVELPLGGGENPDELYTDYNGE